MVITNGCKVDPYLAAYDLKYMKRWYRLFVDRKGKLLVVSIQDCFDCYASWSKHLKIHFEGRYTDLSKAWEILLDLTNTKGQDVPEGIMQFIRRLAIQRFNIDNYFVLTEKDRNCMLKRKKFRT